MDNIYLGNPNLKKRMLLKSLLKSKYLNFMLAETIPFILQKNM